MEKVLVELAEVVKRYRHEMWTYKESTINTLKWKVEKYTTVIINVSHNLKSELP